jgi:hypothetical protein
LGRRVDDARRGARGDAGGRGTARRVTHAYFGPLTPRGALRLLSAHTPRQVDADGEREFIFTPDRQVYSERERVVRVWRRLRAP